MRYLRVPSSAADARTPWDVGVWADTPATEELFVLNESLLGEGGVIASDDDRDLFEELLVIIGSGSFPGRGKREELSTGQQHQLRDAMCLEAHVRAGGDVFVTTDLEGFVNAGRRELLEARCQTLIVTPDELLGTFLPDLRKAIAG
jgi:hypothetical protein